MSDPFGLKQRKLSYGPTIAGTPGVPNTVDERGFEIDHANETTDIWWGGYQYVVGFDRCDTPDKAIAWLHHIGEKTWKFTTGERMMAWLAALSEIHGWDLYKSV